MIDASKRHVFLTELRNGTALRDQPYVLQLLGCVPLAPGAAKQPSVLVFPYCPKTVEQLQPLLLTNAMAERRLQLVATSLVAALNVRRAGFVHRDFKADNFFVDAPSVLIGDFGYSKTPSSTNPNKTSIYTLGMNAPDHKQARASEDVYQLGLVLYDLVATQRVSGIVCSKSESLFPNVQAPPHERIAEFLQQELRSDLGFLYHEVHGTKARQLVDVVRRFVEKAMLPAPQRATWYDIRCTWRECQALGAGWGVDVGEGDPLDEAVAAAVEKACRRAKVRAPDVDTTTQDGALGLVAELAHRLHPPPSDTKASASVGALRQFLHQHASSLVSRERLGEFEKAVDLIGNLH